MEDRKRKENPSAEEISEDRPAKKTETGLEAGISAEAGAAAITNAIDASALTGDPTVDMQNLEAVAPKVLPKPISPEELAHWNQMFFDLMVRISTVSYCSATPSFMVSVFHSLIYRKYRNLTCNH